MLLSGERSPDPPQRGAVRVPQPRMAAALIHAGKMVFGKIQQDPVHLNAVPWATHRWLASACSMGLL